MKDEDGLYNWSFLIYILLIVLALGLLSAWAAWSLNEIG